MDVRACLNAVIAAGVAVALSLPSPAWAQRGNPQSKKKVVCWTEDSGLRACGDSVPAEYSGNERRVLDASGRVVRTVPAALTPEQRAAKTAAAEAAAAQKKKADEQLAYDRSLLTAYTRPQELAALRDERLATIDATIALREKSLAREQASLEDLRLRLPSSAPGDGAKAAPPKLLEQIASFEKNLRDSRQNLVEQRRRRDEVCQTFGRDIERYQQIKSGSVDFVSPCPAAAPPGPDNSEEARIAGAQKLFEGFQTLATGRSADVFGLYADDALILYGYTSNAGKAETVEMSLDEYRSEMLDAWTRLKPGAQATQFSDLLFEGAPQGGARIRGKRVVEPGQPPMPFYVVVRPDPSGQWRIVEQWSEARF